MPLRRSPSDDPADPRPQPGRSDERETTVEISEPEEETDIEQLEGFDETVTE